jgi:hypothetical protein
MSSCCMLHYMCPAVSVMSLRSGEYSLCVMFSLSWTLYCEDYPMRMLYVAHLQYTSQGSTYQLKPTQQLLTIMCISANNTHTIIATTATAATTTAAAVRQLAESNHSGPKLQRHLLLWCKAE